MYKARILVAQVRRLVQGEAELAVEDGLADVRHELGELEAHQVQLALLLEYILLALRLVLLACFFCWFPLGGGGSLPIFQSHNVSYLAQL